MLQNKSEVFFPSTKANYNLFIITRFSFPPPQYSPFLLNFHLPLGVLVEWVLAISGEWEKSGMEVKCGCDPSGSQSAASGSNSPC